MNADARARNEEFFRQVNERIEDGSQTVLRRSIRRRGERGAAARDA
jgi:hypothetical protein